jgi:hypothetical protein
LGGNGKAEDTKLQGAGIPPEAVLNEKGGMETMYELKANFFWETEGTIHTGHSPTSRSACWWTKGEQGSGHRIVGMTLREATMGRGESYVEDHWESERRGKGRNNAHGGN